MTTYEPTALEKQILKLILDFYNSHYKYPNNAELLAQLRARINKDFKQQQLTNYKSRLLKRRWITSRGHHRNTKIYELTERGSQALGTKFPTPSTTLPLFGEVIAGPSDTGNLIVEEAGLENVQLIEIPEINPEKDTFVLEVIGSSMVEDGINEGDYVIVESCSIDDISSGDLIVTKYLATEHNLLEEEQLQIQINDPEQYSSRYTVKYCYTIPDPQKRVYEIRNIKYIRWVYRLQQQRVKLLGGEVDENSTLITSHIRPLGKVIGVYKPFNKERRRARSRRPHRQ
ncbi:LexA family protein [Chloroflexota bacterium]